MRKRILLPLWICVSPHAYWLDILIFGLWSKNFPSSDKQTFPLLKQDHWQTFIQLLTTSNFPQLNEQNVFDKKRIFRCYSFHWQQILKIWQSRAANCCICMRVCESLRRRCFLMGSRMMMKLINSSITIPDRGPYQWRLLQLVVFFFLIENSALRNIAVVICGWLCCQLYPIVWTTVTMALVANMRIICFCCFKQNRRKSLLVTKKILTMKIRHRKQSTVAE